jgi:hypothetical protein
MTLAGCEIGIPFQDSLEHVWVVDGKTAVSGQLLLRLPRSRRQSSDDALVEILDATWRAAVRMRHPGLAWIESTFDVDAAENQGLLWRWQGSPGQAPTKVENDLWHAHRENALFWRAIVSGARKVFPEIVGDLYWYDELLSGPLCDPLAVVPGKDPPQIPEPDVASSPGTKRTKKLPQKIRDTLLRICDDAARQTSPDYLMGKLAADDARYKETRRLIYEDACTRVLRCVPDSIEPDQAAAVTAYLEARVQAWAVVHAAITAMATDIAPNGVAHARDRIWTEAWATHAQCDLCPANLASASAALAERMLRGVTRNHERVLADRKKDGHKSK